MNLSIDFLKVSKLIMLFALIFSTVSIGYSQYASANTADPLLEGKTEEEVEAEVKAYIEELEQSQVSNQSNQINSDLQIVQPANAQKDCIVSYMGAAYSNALSVGMVLALYDNPSWEKFWDTAKHAVTNGAKGTIAGIAYQLYQAHKACSGAGTIA